ncbi:Retrotransposable element Tf2 [Cucumis melo var. makuwa]|uniref:Retrotransposable element Tf2 n=1 Tax=Cucumis melo var. makuwa TaxID=1194695 RepID=A0A5A7TNP1_CUCMM|nr:Retrotransposable element Tf2 [Cucumis melo var. makuwa]
MVQTRIEERMESFEQEVAGIKKELMKMPVIESTLIELTKNMEMMRLRSEKQQQANMRNSSSLRKKRNEKLSPKFFGPYKVIEKIGPVAYKLELPVDTFIHLVFHVSQLKKMVGEHVNVYSTAQYLTETHEWKAVPQEGAHYRKDKLGKWEVLISWEGLPKHEATWEKYEEVQMLYPDFHLEDKVNLEGHSNDRLPFILQYNRKGKKKHV